MPDPLPPRPPLDTAPDSDAVETALASLDPRLDVPTLLRGLAPFAAGLPLPGHGQTRRLWHAFADVAAHDVEVARMLEPHADALAILDQADAAGIDVAAVAAAVAADDRATWGVFAAEGPDVRLSAEETADGWRISGTKPWCSLAGHLSHALVTAWVDGERRGLFAVHLRHPGVRARTGPWVSRGLRRVASAPVDFTDVPAAPIGAPGWYLQRPGFTWGGMGVAAVWFGGARGLLPALTARAAATDDALTALHLGAADAALHAAGAVLDAAADAVDARVAGADAKILAERVRAVVADAAERVLTAADRALGPGPLTADEPHARRVADLRVYLRQHHAERDLARLGRLVSA